ncbi:MAG TPA: 5-formyltetrahydrofolate cyclo-ligase [Candidatus Bathyarchaeia archaeon]|nr:5-formyltetrahydrofolate cyclo-ligase [Candidatus Bathyarchaeia archaeon]
MSEPEPGISLEKEQLRNYILRLRQRLSKLEVEEKSNEILDQILGVREFQQAKVVASYVSKDNEVDTRMLIRRALDQRKQVLVPLVKKDTTELVFSKIKNLGTELAPGKFGVMEPKPEFFRQQDITSANLLFVPGIAWDKEGYRLGWGQGYFDRTLKMLPGNVCSIGLGFDMQFVKRVPRDQFDLPVKMAITESRIIRCQT